MEDVMHNLMYGGLIAALLIGGGTGAYYVASHGDSAAVLDSDLCRKDQRLVAHDIVLLDVSDVMTSDERRLVRQVADQEAAGAAPYERLSIYAIEAARPFDPPRLFSACAPRNASAAHGPSENPALYADIWQHHFGDPLVQTIDAETAKGPQNESPLIETLWHISRLNDFNPDSGVVHRRLVCVSDMLQNTQYSQYRNFHDYVQFSRTNFGKLYLPDLRGVDVVIYYLLRPATAHLQTKKHAQFWLDFFKAAGASSVKIIGAPRAT
jgi:hypothetical protein